MSRLSPICLAGFPATMAYGGTSAVTTEPRPRTAWSPICTPSTIPLPAPTHTSLPMRIPFDVHFCCRTGTSGAKPWLKANMWQPAAIRVPSPTAMPLVPQSRWQRGFSVTCAPNVTGPFTKHSAATAAPSPRVIYFPGGASSVALGARNAPSLNLTTPSTLASRCTDSCQGGAHG